MATIVTYNKGAQITHPAEHYDTGDPATAGNYIFEDFHVAAPTGWTNTGSAAVDGTYGTSLYLDDADEIEYAGASELFKPRASNSFAGKSRTKLVYGATDTTVQQIGFLDSSIASPTEAIGFSIATAGNTADPLAVITCTFNDGSANSSVALASTELPGGAAGFDVTAWHTYAVLVEVDADSKCVAKYFIDDLLVKTIKTSAISNWAAAGLVWCQTNLTASSTHDQAVDWISLGSSFRG